MNIPIPSNHSPSVWLVINNLPPRYSGAGMNDLRIARHLAGEGLDISFLTVRSPGEPHISELNGLQVYRAGNRESRLATLSWLIGSIRLLMRNHSRPALVRFRGYCLAFALFTFFVRILRPGIRIVVQPACLGEDDPVSQSRCRFGSFRRRQMLNVDAVLAMNPAIARVFGSLGFDEHKVFPVRNIIDGDGFARLGLKQRSRLRSKLGLPQGAVIITLGILDARKGQARVTEAFCRLLTDRPNEDVSLVHIGPVLADLKRLGRFDRAVQTRLEEGRVRRIVEEAGLEARVILAGNVENPQDYLAAADIFVHCSVLEGEANVVNEAMACGLALLIPGNLVFAAQVPRDCALRFSEDSNDDLLQGLGNLVEDVALRQKLGDNARKHVLATRTADLVARDYASLLKAVLQ